MKRELLFAGGIAVVVAASLLVAAVVPGVFAQPREDAAPPGRIDIREVAISPGQVTGSTAELHVETRLRHYGGTSDNVSVMVRAVDLESGMVETTERLDVARLDDDREVAVEANVSVAREGGYRLESVVYQDGRRVAEGSKRVEGVGTLEPAYARTPVGFHRFDDRGASLPVIEYAVADVEDNRTALDVSSRLTNAGDAPAGDLRVVFTARQADSNIVADEAAVSVGEIRPGRTESPGATLTVPAGYNYYLDAVLWKDGVIVGTARSAANLNPTETLSVDETTREVGLEVSDFESDDGVPNEKTEAEYATDAGGQPGFGVVAAVVALAGAAMLFRRNP